MPFTHQLVIESALSPRATRHRLRAFAAPSGMPDLEAYRRRRIVGWRLSRLHEDFLFQPEYGECLDVQGAQFVALVEATRSGSRIRGHIVASAVTKIVMSVSVLTVVVTTVAALAVGREPVPKVLTLAAAMIGGGLVMVRYSLRSLGRLVEARLRGWLEEAEERVAA